IEDLTMMVVIVHRGSEPLLNQQSTITEITITEVAFADPPLLNSVGVHEPYALRAIVVMRSEDGFYGLGETYGDAAHVRRLRRAAERLIGANVFNHHDIAARVSESLVNDSGKGGNG